MSRTTFEIPNSKAKNVALLHINRNNTQQQSRLKKERTFSRIMLSLRFPIPVEIVLSPANPGQSLTQSSRTQTHRFHSSLPLHEPKLQSHRPRATSADVGLKEPLPAGLRGDLMPRHVAVIMDGNVRWARQRGLPSGAGHEAGVRSLRQLVELCGRWGIRVLTVFAFSYDNWIRPKVRPQTSIYIV